MEESAKSGQMHKGTLVHEKGEYFLEMPSVNEVRKVERIPLGSIPDDGKIKDLMGKSVEVLLSKPKYDVIGIMAGDPKLTKNKFVRILCYKPANIDWKNVVVDERLISDIGKQMVESGTLPAEVYEMSFPKNVG